MPVSQVSPSNFTFTSNYVSPYQKNSELPQSAVNAQAAQESQKPQKSASTDTVTFSRQALQKAPESASATEDSQKGTVSQRASARLTTGFSIKG